MSKPQIFSTSSIYNNLLINLVAKFGGLTLETSSQKKIPVPELFANDFSFITEAGTTLYSPVAAARYLEKVSRKENGVLLPGCLCF